jgi:gluconolactonase
MAAVLDVGKGETMCSLLLFGPVFASAAGSLEIGPVETIAEGFQFTEGPLWLAGDELIFSDIPADTIYRADKSVFRRPSGKSNGLTLDPEGRLVACEHWNRRVTRTEADGSITVLADAYQGKKLNSPNDVVVRSDGAVFFTDPPYGLEGREAELDFSGVYALPPDGELTLLAKDFVKPNGLAFSPDERTLYVADTERGHLRAFEVAADGSVSGGGVFCELPRPDGLKVDVKGRIWSTAEDGVRVFDAAGTLLATVAFPHRPSNCAFGGDDLKTLAVTAVHGVYRIQCPDPGIAAGPKP